MQSKREFHECLEGWISPPGREGDECGGGHHRAPRSYVLEANGGCKREGSDGGIRWSVSDTGVDKLKVLRVEDGGGSHEAFMDTTDDRFYVLHTNERPEAAAKIVDVLADGWPHSFDRMWMHHGMVEAILKKAGGSFREPDARHSGGLRRKADEDGCGPAIEGLNSAAGGPMSRTAERAMRNAARHGGAIAASGPRIVRGRACTPDCAIGDVAGTGCFAMKRGRSVPDHLDLVTMSKDVYSGAVDGIEECRPGARAVSGRKIAGDRTIDFAFKTPIPDIRLFIGRVFDTAKPFRLWGLESKLEDGYFDVLGIDLHAGGPVNFEVTKDFMRVYLLEGSCGNTVLRLLANLQICYGKGVACEQVDQLVR